MQPGLDGVAGVLGLGRDGLVGPSPVGVAMLIEKGLSVDALDRVSHAVAPANADFKHRIVSRGVLARRRRRHDERLSPEESGRLARLAKIWVFTCEVWGDEREARDFLFRHHPLLEGRLPVDLVLGSELGADIVEDILGQLQYGSAV